MPFGLPGTVIGAHVALVADEIPGLRTIGVGDDGGFKGSTSGGNPLTAPVDYLGAAAKAHKTVMTKVAGLGLDQTIKIFYAQEGRYPKDLNELISPEYLNAIPPPTAFWISPTPP